MQIVSRCYSLRNRSSILHTLGLLLNLSAIFRFWLDFQLLESLYLLLFNWGVCILLECVAVEILFQIPWKHLKFWNITWLRCSAFVVIFTMGIINIYTMWQVCMQVHDCVILSHQDYNWVVKTPPLWLAMFTAMGHAIVLGKLHDISLLYITSCLSFPVIAICIPFQVIIVPLECNKNIPNINFRSHVTLVVNLWLLVHFLYLCISYSYYNVIALCYRLCCTVWMFLYCYPDRTYNTYHWFKQRLPDCTRPFLRIIRDKLIPKIWRNFRTIIKRRRRKETTVDNTSSQWTVLWMSLRNKPKVVLLSLYVINCISLSCLLKYYTGWDLTVMTPTLLLYLILRCNFCEEFEDIISQLQSMVPDYSSTFISRSDGNRLYDGMEIFMMELPIQCTEFEFSSELD